MIRRLFTGITGLLWLACVFTASTLSAEMPESAVRFSFLATSQSAGSQEAMVVAEGKWFKRRQLVHGAVLVEHPKGAFLYDSGLGRQVESQFAVNNWWAKALFAYENANPVRDQLEAAEYDLSKLAAIIPSHLHWDHASGLVDFPGTPIRVRETEYQAALAGEAPAFIASQLNAPTLNWQFLTLDDGPFLGFAASHDLFDDGSVVLVDLQGHTLGQLGLYLNTGHREYLFIGDTTWTAEGIRHRKPRPAFVQWLVGVDRDPEATMNLINHIADIAESHPQMVIVPAHDEYVAAQLPTFPAFSQSQTPGAAD